MTALPAWTSPKYARYPIPMLTQAPPATVKPESRSDANTPNRFTDFANDATTQFDEAALSYFAYATPAETPILAMGHSHG